jgi:hypothetical protein
LEREHLLYQRTCDVQKNSPEFESKKEDRPRRVCPYKLERIKQLLFLS